MLIFDLDGTLFQTELVTLAAVRLTFEEYGLPVPNDMDVRAFIGKPMYEFMKWIRSICPPDIASAVADATDRKEIELVTENGELFPGVRDALQRLRSTVGQMALCSNGGSEYVSNVLDSQEIGTYFDAVSFRRSAGDGKVRRVGELLGMLKGRPGIVIGDRRDDIEAAHGNGLLAIGATYGYGSPEELVAADATIASFDELPALVETLLAAN